MIAAIRGLLIALLVLAAGIALACNSSSGGSDLENYFKDLERIDTAFEEAGAEADQNFSESVANAGSEDEALQLYRQSFAEFAFIVEGFIDDIDALDPPPEAEDAHNDAVTSGREVVAIFDELTAQAQSATSPTEAERLASDLLDDAAFQRLDSACIALQGIADDNGIDIELDCEE